MPKRGGGQCRERERERAAEINLHTVARDSTASEPIHAGIVIKLRFSVTGAPAVTKLQVMPRVTQRRSARRLAVPYGLRVIFKMCRVLENVLNLNYVAASVPQ